MLLGWIAGGAAQAGNLEDELGRSEVRVRSAPYVFPLGRTVEQMRLKNRLDALGYRRVDGTPKRAGEFGASGGVFWIYRRSHRVRGRHWGARLIGLALDPKTKKLIQFVGADGDSAKEIRAKDLWLEPEVIAETLDGNRIPREVLGFEQFPEHLWKAVLAAEDARFLDHWGLDAKGIARAILANLKAGKVEQGGSTITQQLVKMRELTPKRTLGRKASEAVRALALEAEYDKEEILASYLNHVYMGHLGGQSIHGFGTAARMYFSKRAQDVSLDEAAAMAAMVQGPNRLSPVRHPDRLKVRRDWVLTRMVELGYTTEAEAVRAKRRPIRIQPGKPPRPLAPHFMSWVAARVEEAAPKRSEKGRGFVVETGLDPELQRLANRGLEQHLDRLRRDFKLLQKYPLQASLVALDAETGDVLAYVAGDPASPGSFDRIRQARRQPGSTLKPLVLLEAFESCGDRLPLYPSRAIRNSSFTLDLPNGPWSPENPPGSPSIDPVTVREAVRHSLNLPFARIGNWCGWDATASRLRRTGLSIPDPPPPSFVLGALEISPLQLGSAYTTLTTPGLRLVPRPIRRLERPAGRGLETWKVSGKRVVSAESAYMVRELLRDAAAKGTAQSANLETYDVAAKTGTSSEKRDAWLAGHSNAIVTVVWVGLDSGGRLGLGGSQAAAPLWKSFMGQAIPSHEVRSVPRPRGVTVDSYDPRTGLRVREGHRRAQKDLFRLGARPPRKRIWKNDDPIQPVR